MKTIETMGAQGDVMFRRVASIPEGAEAQKRVGPIVVAHSETGHHHTIPDECVTHYARTDSPLVSWLKIDGDHADVVHQRTFDTHETLRLGGGAWEVRRQREHTPEGWRRVDD